MIHSPPRFERPPRSTSSTIHLLHGYIAFSFLCWYKLNHQHLLLVHLLAHASRNHSQCSCHFQAMSFTSTPATWSPPTISCFCNELPSSSWTPCHWTPIPITIYCFHGYSLKVSPPPGYYVPSRYIFHRTGCPRLSRCIEDIHPLKIDHRSEYCSF